MIVALGGQDTVRAGAGHDVVCGGDSADVLEGGPGADRLFGELEDTVLNDPELKGDLLRGGPGDDHLDPGYHPTGRRNLDQIRWNDSPRGVQVDLEDGLVGTSTGFGTDTLVLRDDATHDGPQLVLTRYGDVVKGSPLRDKLKTGRGSDIVYAGAGDDDIQVDADRQDTAAVDLVQAGAGDDAVKSSAGADRVYLGKGNDYFSGGESHHVKVRGQRGDDDISAHLLQGPGFSARGDQGNDHIDLRPPEYGTALLHRVVVDAWNGRVRVRGGPVGVLSGFESFDLHDQRGLRYVFRGTSGPDELRGSDGSLRAWTFGGNDTVTSGRSADFIDTGSGSDQVDAGPGQDRCLNAEIRERCEVID